MLKKNIFFLIFFLLSCKEKSKLLFPENTHLSSIIIQTNMYLQNNKLQSTNFGIGEILFCVFQNTSKIDKVKLIQYDNDNYDRIERLRVYTNNGFVGSFAPENIVIKQKINFLLLIVDSTKRQKLTNVYTSSYYKKFAFENLNAPIGIENLIFYTSDTSILPTSFINKKCYEKKQKFVKIYNEQKYFKTLSYSNQRFLAFCQGSNADTLYLSGFYPNQSQKIILYNNKTVINTIRPRLIVKNKKVSIENYTSFEADIDDSAFVDLKTLDTNIIIDLKYATSDNFTKKQIYECGIALLRYIAAKDLIQVSKYFNSQGLKIKIFDAYRPLAAQYKLWEVVPNINFVAPPEKGSIHNRGTAIDITLTDWYGNELDMGTSYDYFGKEAFSDYQYLSQQQKHNRELLRSILEKYNFAGIKTEWWHYSHRTSMLFPIENFPLPCQ